MRTITIERDNAVAVLTSELGFPIHFCQDDSVTVQASDAAACAMITHRLKLMPPIDIDAALVLLAEAVELRGTDSSTGGPGWVSPSPPRRGIRRHEPFDRAAGVRFAKELVLTGRFATTDELRQRGIVTAVYEPGELQSNALELARNIAAKPPLAVAAAKRLVDDGIEMAASVGRTSNSRCSHGCARAVTARKASRHSSRSDTRNSSAHDRTEAS